MLIPHLIGLIGERFKEMNWSTHSSQQKTLKHIFMIATSFCNFERFTIAQMKSINKCEAENVTLKLFIAVVRCVAVWFNSHRIIRLHCCWECKSGMFRDIIPFMNNIWIVNVILEFDTFTTRFSLIVIPALLIESLCERMIIWTLKKETYKMLWTLCAIDYWLCN